jgi:hypothetical protein
MQPQVDLFVFHLQPRAFLLPPTWQDHHADHHLLRPAFQSVIYLLTATTLMDPNHRPFLVARVLHVVQREARVREEARPR